MAHKTSGFTLIELMVVVAVVAILAAIALPSFADQMRKSRRAEAVTSLQEAQLRLERWRVDRKDFTDSKTTFPPSIHYKFTLTANAATPNNYIVSAEPLLGQVKDKCGTMTITNTDGTIKKTAAADTGCW